MKLSTFVPVVALSLALTGTLAAQASKAPASPKAQKGAEKSGTATEEKGAAKKGAAPKMTAADLPAPVRDAVMKAHPNGTIASATSSMMGADTVYNVRVTDGGKTSTMRLKADGTMATATKAKGEPKAKGEGTPKGKGK